MIPDDTKQLHQRTNENLREPDQMCYSKLSEERGSKKASPLFFVRAIRPAFGLTSDLRNGEKAGLSRYPEEGRHRHRVPVSREDA